MTFENFEWSDPVDHSNRVTRDEPLMNPFRIIIDTREQAPWQFTGFKADAKKKYRPLVIDTITKGLESGDYSIEGHELAISIERKSLSDAFGTFTAGRDRFERELERLSRMTYAAVIIEASWEDILAGPKNPSTSVTHQKTIGKTVYRSILAWSQRFPRIHWFPMGSRAMAESTCFRILERYWSDWEWKQKELGKVVEL